MKLTEKQRQALAVLPINLTVYGGRSFGRIPNGVHSIRTLESLRSRGLATCTTDRATQKWRLTAAGRALLAEEKRDA